MIRNAIKKFCQGCSAEFFCEESAECWCNKRLFGCSKKFNAFSTDGLGCYCPRCLDDVIDD